MSNIGNAITTGGSKPGVVAPPGNIIIPPPEDLEWITIRTQLESAHNTESMFKRRFKENPFVPIGCFVTAGVLSYGIYSFSKGRTHMSQKMMRYRIVAQGATILAIIGGVLVGASRKNN